MKKTLIIILFLQIFFLSVSDTKKSVLAEDQLPSWNSGIREKIVSYTDMVTDPKNPGFIPESERFAVFDNDGTLWAEQPVIEELFIIYYAKKMIEWCEQKTIHFVQSLPVTAANKEKRHTL